MESERFKKLLEENNAKIAFAVNAQIQEFANNMQILNDERYNGLNSKLEEILDKLNKK